MEDCSSLGAEAWKETVRTLTLSKLDVFGDFFTVFVPLLDYFV